MSTARSPPACRIRFVIPSGPSALSEGRCFICVLISSRVGLVLSCGSGIGESEGWGASKSAVLVWLLLHPRGRQGALVDRG